jgi:Uma2 family endonuclease
MATEKPRAIVECVYYEAAQEYLRNLPLEHHMEATPQAYQRKITLESLDVVHAQKPEVQLFNELLVQYPLRGQKKPRQVVPDNMVVIHDEPIKAEGSFDIPLQPVKPFWMLEYVSKRSKRKDYDDNLQHYEHDLKVPYYLLFQPDVQEMTLYRHNGKKYVSVKPNVDGRYALPELELEVALLDGWVRYWFRGELVPLPAELLAEVNELRQRWQTEKRRADKAERRADAAEQELARLRALLEQQKD